MERSRNMSNIGQEQDGWNGDLLLGGLWSAYINKNEGEILKDDD